MKRVELFDSKIWPVNDHIKLRLKATELCNLLSANFRMAWTSSCCCDSILASLNGLFWAERMPLDFCSDVLYAMFTQFWPTKSGCKSRFHARARVFHGLLVFRGSRVAVDVLILWDGGWCLCGYFELQYMHVIAAMHWNVTKNWTKDGAAALPRLVSSYFVPPVFSSQFCFSSILERYCCVIF